MLLRSKSLLIALFHDCPWDLVCHLWYSRVGWLFSKPFWTLIGFCCKFLASQLSLKVDSKLLSHAPLTFRIGHAWVSFQEKVSQSMDELIICGNGEVYSSFNKLSSDLTETTWNIISKSKQNLSIEIYIVFPCKCRCKILKKKFSKIKLSYYISFERFLKTTHSLLKTIAQKWMVLELLQVEI